MTVSELIEELKKYPPDMQAAIYYYESSSDGDNGWDRYSEIIRVGVELPDQYAVVDGVPRGTDILCLKS